MNHWNSFTPIQRYNLILATHPTHEEDKRIYAEILTPINICQEMINTSAKYCKCLQVKLNDLPAIIEPCCGKGAFCVCLYEKLRELGYNEQ